MSQDSQTGTLSTAAAASMLRPKRSFWFHLGFFFRKKPLGAFGAVVATVLILIAVLAPFITPHDPDKSNSKDRHAKPNTENWFGTDDFGRDVFSRLIMGARISLRVGVISAFAGCAIGLIIGIVSSYFGGAVDLLVQRLVDGLISFPALVLALAIVAALGSSLNNVTIALSILFIPSTARIVRSRALSIKEMDYVLAAKSVGAHHGRIIFRHIFPNCMSVFIVLVTYQLGVAIIAEAGLSFLGLGVGVDEPSWGTMLRAGSKGYVGVNPLLPVFPGLAIAVVVFSWNILGDGLRDVLDPRLRGAG